MSNGKQVWIVVESKPGQEIRAKKELKHQGFEVYLPMVLYELARVGVRAKPLFPRYMFVHVSTNPADWRSIYSTIGVSGVLGCTLRHAVGVQDRIVQRIRDQEEDGYIKMGLAGDRKPQAYSPGQRVRVAVGDADIEAVFVDYVDHRAARILQSLLSRDSPVIVDLRKLSADQVHGGSTDRADPSPNSAPKRGGKR